MITNRKGATAQRWMMIVIAGVVGIGLLTGIFFFLGNLLPKAEMESAGTYCYSGTGEKVRMQVSFEKVIQKMRDAQGDLLEEAEMDWKDVAVAFVPVYGQYKTAQNAWNVGTAAVATGAYDDAIAGMKGLEDQVNALMGDLEDNWPNRCKQGQTEKIDISMNADSLSYFLYQASINAFYNLYGSTENAITGFDIYEITATVNGPGTFLMDGLCTKWIDESVEDSRVISNPASNNKCNITVSFVDESTMILAAMERCMNARDREGNAGPKSGACICFVKEELSGKLVYSDANGLGNSEISVRDNERISSAIKTSVFRNYGWGDSYLGCGAEPEPFIFNVSEIGGDRITWLNKQGISQGNSGILLFSVRNRVDGSTEALIKQV